MKVCFLGGARYTRPLDNTSESKFRALETMGEAYVIGFSDSLRPRVFTQTARFYLMPLLPVPVLRYATMLFLGTLLTSWVLFKHGARVVISQSPYEALGAALVKRVAGWLGVKVILVVESHGGFSDNLFQQRTIWFPSVYRVLMAMVARITLAEADLLRAISNSTRTELEKWMPGKTTIQFPAWSDMETFIAAGFGRTRPAIETVLFAGAFIPRKGIHDLINAFAALADSFPAARLIVIGPLVNRHYATRLRELVAGQRLGRRVVFCREIPAGELASRMAKATVFVVPSLSEGLGRVVFEAMATGTPVIASRVDGIPDMIEDGVTGLLSPPGDPDQLVERLRWILNHPDEASAMGQRGRASAMQFFSREKYIGGYAAVFEAAAGLLARHESSHASPAF